jgi:Phage tail tube protein, GTA-gp10
MAGARIAWAGGEHQFALRLGELRALQDACNAGPHEILTKLNLGTWRVDDPIRTVQFGLMGGGMERAEASKLAVSVAEMHGLVEVVQVAAAVLAAALAGVADDPVGESVGVTQTKSPESCDSAASTDPAQ